MPDMNENAETQQEYFEMVRTDNTETLKNALDKIAELETQIAELKADNDARKYAMAMSEKVEKQLREENAELKNERNAFKIYSDNAELDAIKLNDQLTKAKEIIKKLKALYLSPVVTKDDVKRQDEILNEAEQFLKYSEVEK